MSVLDLKSVSHARGDVTLPGSKSLSNRALILAALAEGTTQLRNLLVSDDVQHMLTALTTLGVGLDISDGGTEVDVTGHAGAIQTQDGDFQLYLGNSGTTFRGLCAALCLSPGTFQLEGEPRMHERPIEHLVDALRGLGAQIEYLGSDGYPPLRIEGRGLTGGKVSIPGNISSQFLTSILMAAPLAQTPTEIEVIGEQVSKPYLGITLDAMRRFGVEVEHDDFQAFRVPTGRYVSPAGFLVEGDASSATYFLAAGAISGGPVRVHGVGRGSVQGDVAFTRVLEAMGARVEIGEDWIEASAPNGKLKAIDMDLNPIPDAAMTVAAVALFADGPSVIRNVYNLRVKETDRIQALATELRKLGAQVEAGEDYLKITPPTRFNPATIDTYDDHRMAMSLSLAALGGVDLKIRDPECVSKTFPAYFDTFESICIRE
jgi:3-phosphoshikimate 1-carboxyvinyltransferase